MNHKKFIKSIFRSILTISTAGAVLIATNAKAQMPIQPMPGTPRPPMPGTPPPPPAQPMPGTPHPQPPPPPAPYPQPHPQPPPPAPYPQPHPQPPPAPYPPPPPYQPQPPAPPYQPQPPHYGGCYMDLCVGDRLFNVSRDYREVIIEGIEPSGTYLLRFLDTNGIGGNWSRSDLAVQSGCRGDICVGMRARNIQRDYREVMVVGIEYDGQFVLRFLDTNGVGGRWDRSDLALEQGCGRYYCVGDFARNIQRDYRQVQIVAIEFNGNYVLRFLDTNGVGGGWTDNDLVR